MSCLKVLHLPSAVGGNAFGLSRGERKLGLLSDILIIEGRTSNYPSDINLNLDAASWKAVRYLKKIRAFFSVRNRYDVFHFNYGSSLLHAPAFRLNQLDLPFYPGTAKLFVTYNGCDARQKYPTMQREKIAPCHNVGCYKGMCNSGELDKQRRLGIEKMARYVQHMWALNPDLLHFLPPEKASFLPYTVCHFDQMPYPLRLNKRLKVVHAPTNREGKGTHLILTALEKIQQKFPELIEVVLVEGVPYNQALEIYRSADLVIDQILAGWYGAFAVETMLMGKPIIARINLADLKFIPQQMAEDVQETIIHAEPDTIYHVLQRVLFDRELLRRTGEASIEYARKWHHPHYVASLTNARYESE